MMADRARGSQLMARVDRLISAFAARDVRTE
jgi:hypothetical protein